MPGVTDAPAAPPFTLAGPDLRKPRRPSPALLLGVTAVLLAVGYFLFVVPAREAAARRTERERFEQIVNALHAFHDVHGRFPQSVGTRGPEGRPLLSWRVLILPYIEEEALYRRFRLDEPWDGPNNLPLLAQMPRAFRRGDDPEGKGGLTHCLTVTGPGCAFDEAYPGAQDKLTERGWIRLGMPIQALTTSYVFLVTAAAPVPWTKPEDFDALNGDIASRLDARFGPWAQVARANGYPHRMRHASNARILAAFRGESDPPE